MKEHPRRRLRAATAFQQPVKKGQLKIVHLPPEGLKPQPKQEETSFAKYLCPWCLREYPASQYLTRLKSGKVAKKGECPSCSHRMMIDTLRLVYRYSPEEFAEWVYERGHYGFWHEIKFQDWKHRLNEIGIAQPFWDRYRELKAKNSLAGNEGADYADYMASNSRDKAYKAPAPTSKQRNE